MMKIIDTKDFETRLSGRDEVNINDMSLEVRNYYLFLYSLYMDLFLKFLIKKTRIKEFDNKLNNDNLSFEKCSEEDRDFYQYFSSDYLNYYYLRNNLYIYRLTREENEFLKNILISQSAELTDEIMTFIESTYKKVIFEKVDHNEVTEVNYSTSNVLHLAPNNSIVIGVRYNEFDNGLEDEQWLDNYLKQKEVLQEDCLSLSKNVSEVLKCSCAVFEYSDESVKKKVNEELREKNNLGL